MITEITMEIGKLEMVSNQVRRDILRMTNGSASGHPGGSLGCADFLVALYFEIMNHKKDFTMDGMGEDIFFLSNGHICPAWYSVLARSGYFRKEELETFRKLDSRLQGHPAPAEGLPGIRMASGSLGQGLSVSIGAALAKKLNNDPHLVYSLHGDGEMQEGQNWEAMMFAAHHKVDNLISTIDWNNAQIDGKMEDVMSLGDLHAKCEAFGWTVLEMNGNNMQEVIETLEIAKNKTGLGKPIMILMRTKIGKGIDFMEDDYRWHGAAPDDEQLAIALSQLEETLGDY